jgi:calcineurin-like phosphoesterase
VPTADARVLPGGTAYVTDIGMTGSHAGVIGYRAQLAIQRQVLARRIRLELADGDVRLQGAVIEVDVASGRAASIERIDLEYSKEADSG